MCPNCSIKATLPQHRLLEPRSNFDFFGEASLLTSAPRNDTVRSKSYCDFFALDKSDFKRVLRDHPQFLESMMKIARTRYNVSAEEVLPEEDFG